VEPIMYRITDEIKQKRRSGNISRGQTTASSAGLLL